MSACARPAIACCPTASGICVRLPALHRIYPQELLDESIYISQLCRFSLNDLRYEYPHEVVPDGRSASDHLRELTEAGIRQRWPRGETPAVRTQIEHELALIAELKYESYFLTVHDIVRFARSQRSSARAAARRPIRRSAMRSASPRSIRPAATCCSSASFRANATSRPTSTSISNTNAAKR